LGASEAHLSKVLQRLVRSGLVESVRGRGGGFRLARRAEGVRLLDVYQAMEGKLGQSECLMGKRVCEGKECILGGLLHTLDTWLRAYLSGTK
ncbi:MAG: Rrf2 family transcriptional regulator, partial [Gemmatimonadales bacterium]|nr:Rrf2 family transcriptional regulator [Gemmatimonadales bacterium]